MKQGHARHQKHDDHHGHEELFRRRFFICLALSFPVLLLDPAIQNLLGFRLHFYGSDWLVAAFSSTVFALGGTPFLKMAVPELRKRQPGMMTLISLAISIAFSYSLYAQAAVLSHGFFWELVTLVDVMLLGHWMEIRSIRQASGALQELAKLLPDQAEVVQPDGSTELVSISNLRKGNVVLVRPGTTIPADGVVIDGESSVNEALITGESKPVRKKKGDRVIGGSINGDGSLRIKVYAIGDDTVVAGIMRLVEQAQRSKSSTQLLADRAAGWLFYVAIITGLITFFYWAYFHESLSYALMRTVTVLVIACPHALGLAVPLVVAITTALGAQNGLLIRNRHALEDARHINTVAFDKTGTLTEGRFVVVDFAVVPDFDEKEALALAAGLQYDSEHPIAKAIKEYVISRNIKPLVIYGFTALKGRGVKGFYGDRELYIGGNQLLKSIKVKLEPKLQTFMDEAGKNAWTAVFLVVNRRAVAGFAVADAVRPESKVAVNSLHQMGIKVAMLTGDNRQVAEAVAQNLKIDVVFAELLPEEKVEAIKELQKSGEKVAMVGDGINDAPALIQADVGIAIGAGTDVAIESADIVLVKNNPNDVVKLIRLGQASYRKMVQNLWWAAGYNIFAIPAAAGVFHPFGVVLSPAVGALLMSLSTVIVALNAQLLRRVKL